MSLYLLLLVHILLVSTINNVTTNKTMEVMDLEGDELTGLIDVLGSLLDDPSWASDHPKPCTDTPWLGIECEVDQDEDPPIFHVTKIHIGLDISNPPCKPYAFLSHSLEKLPYLKTLSIFNCFTSSLVLLSSSLKVTPSLEHLSLGSNPSLIGSIPTSLGHALNLRVLSLSQNGLQGSIPKELGGLENLEQLDLSYNNLSGEIPQIFHGFKKSLKLLDLSFNNFEGYVPISLGQLYLLQKLDLSSNNLHGSIPTSLGYLKMLSLMDLSHNILNGPIPSSFSRLGSLEYLLLDHNPINSEIPCFLGALKSLKTLSLSRCGLIGEIPTMFSSLKRLSTLLLDKNSLKGTIPQSLGSLPDLGTLNLSQNQLNGEVLIPQETVHRLGKRLDVRGNKGLCKGKMSYNKNVSFYLPIPYCLDGLSASDSNNTFGERMKQENLVNGSSSCSSMSLLLSYKEFFFLLALSLSFSHF